MSDRYVPVGVAHRDGFGLPFEVVVPGRQRGPLPVFDDQHRVVGQVWPNGQANWIGVDQVKTWQAGTRASAAAAQLIAREGKITARVDDKRNVIGLRISRR
jgi:hypothetical protein